MQKAWQDNPEPPDHDEPTLRDRLEAMPKDELVDALIFFRDNVPGAYEDIDYWVTQWEQEQIDATP